VSADLQRIGWLRSAVLVCVCAFVAFGAWRASGANVGASHDADVKVRAVQARPAPAPAAAAPAPRARVKHHAAITPAAQTPTQPRTHLCTRADGHHYRVDAKIKCLKLTNPSRRLLDRARQHKTIITPVQPAAPAPGATPPQPTPGATGGSPSPAPGKPSSPPPAKPAPKQPAPQAGTGGAKAPPS
jgi:hypothetical protein